MNWNLADFIVVGALLLGAGLAYSLVTKKVRKKKNRVIIGAIIAAVVAYIWVELAVGLFTNWGS